MGGNHRLKDLAAAADETGGAAFAMYPTSMEELMTIADEGKLMRQRALGLNRSSAVVFLSISFQTDAGGFMDFL